MKISIITVTYNSESYLQDCINSILHQDYPDIEYIVIDGASKDNTINIIRSCADKISHFISEPDRGIYDAMNKGILLAIGDVVGILNSDDFYTSGAILAQVAALFNSSGCDALYGDLEYVDSQNTGKVVREWIAGEYKENAFLYGWMPPHPTFFVKRVLYEQYGLFNTELKSAADYEMMLRLIHRYKVKLAYLPVKMIKMRTGGMSNASLKNRLRANIEDRKAWALNGLTPPVFTLFAKPFRKLTQFKLFNK